MKIEEKTTVIPEQIKKDVVYVANDGKEFSTKRDCIEYEKDAENNYILKKIKKIRLCDKYDDLLINTSLAYYLKSDKEKEVLLYTYRDCDWDNVDKVVLNTWLILFFKTYTSTYSNDYDTIYVYTLDEIKDQLENYLKEFEK